jgi:hypothetical protein
VTKLLGVPRPAGGGGAGEGEAGEDDDALRPGGDDAWEEEDELEDESVYGSSAAGDGEELEGDPDGLAAEEEDLDLEPVEVMIAQGGGKLGMRLGIMQVLYSKRNSRRNALPRTHQEEHTPWSCGRGDVVTW